MRFMSLFIITRRRKESGTGRKIIFPIVNYFSLPGDTRKNRGGPFQDHPFRDTTEEWLEGSGLQGLHLAELRYGNGRRSLAGAR
jgi:hypothetical protein